jgi:hypothetical protein
MKKNGENMKKTKEIAAFCATQPCFVVISFVVVNLDRRGINLALQPMPPGALPPLVAAIRALTICRPRAAPCLN